MVLKMCSKLYLKKSSGLFLHLQTTVIFLHRLQFIFSQYIVLFFCMNNTYLVLEMVIMVVWLTEPWHLLGWNNPNFLISHICFFATSHSSHYEFSWFFCSNFGRIRTFTSTVESWIFKVVDKSQKHNNFWMIIYFLVNVSIPVLYQAMLLKMAKKSLLCHWICVLCTH